MINHLYFLKSVEEKRTPLIEFIPKLCLEICNIWSSATKTPTVSEDFVKIMLKQLIKQSISVFSKSSSTRRDESVATFMDK